MEIEFHKCNWRVDAKVVDIMFLVASNPGEICFVQVCSKQLHSMFEDLIWIVLVESNEQADQIVSLISIEE